MMNTKWLHRPNVGLLIIRIVLGVIFIYAGYMKLANMEQTIGFFAMMGFGTFWAYVVAIIELVGGILMVVGYGTRIAGLLLGIIMIIAIVKVHAAQGFGMVMGPLMIAASALAISVSGCGKYSVCGMCHGKNCNDCKEGGKCVCQH